MKDDTDRDPPGRSPRQRARRRTLWRLAATVLGGYVPLSLHAQSLSPTATAPDTLPDIAALRTLLAGRSPRWERVKLEMPAFADNGQAVPARIAMSGPFTPSAPQSIHLFSERNPVAEMAVFEFPLAPDRVEIDTRVRLAGSQRIVAIAVMSDASVYAGAADVEVTIAGCLDAS
jgi:sulfur-oxidizing protein SoxY